MSWFQGAQESARNEGYRDGKADALRELKSEQAREISNTRRACLEELLQEDPENIYYSSNDIRYFLACFYTADRNGDGRLTLKELCDIYKPKDEEAKKKLEADFEDAEVTGDQKINLAEFFILGLLGSDRKAGYKIARKVDE
ncbi:hypothetical protein ANOM_000313 [Aspergillus nomiae NRRL 13137]|uniref:EF-hand domain-containing protein n=1 Tax=Aspergillus nomiae NRRL (strain ATCC 15546 / NRRL 13137 / CBS 260.88 / M93) TaxID=1509407 RepID=A0A0L1JHJ3_ASPN3|nr:uncharacterized protein ANOM_000313 [Aspergillus nomiae NRRL 13137]KNG91240.1 hypothetical protein ANOM_000313 [Aspergillus nomiae NRRL 13137]